MDSIPTAANQEDHVSMATFAARRLAEIVDNARGIVAIELIAAAQGLDFAARWKRRRSWPRRWPSSGPRPFWDRDRAFAPDLEAMRVRVERGDFVAFAPNL